MSEDCTHGILELGIAFSGKHASITASSELYRGDNGRNRQVRCRPAVRLVTFIFSFCIADFVI